jgi:hypothetical protein
MAQHPCLHPAHASTHEPAVGPEPASWHLALPDSGSGGKTRMHLQPGLSRQHGHHPTEQSLIEAQVVKGGSHLHSDDVGGLFAAGRAFRLLRA